MPHGVFGSMTHDGLDAPVAPAQRSRQSFCMVQRAMAIACQFSNQCNSLTEEHIRFGRVKRHA
eukprot:scaffold21838_cov16-Tisochrysis_lutea.AAC.7